jgi:hypothetical protein
MKLYEHSKQTYQDGEETHTWQFGIINDISLLWVNFESPGGVIHSSGGINLLFSFFGNSLMSVDFQQRRFCLAFAFITEYDD